MNLSVVPLQLINLGNAMSNIKNSILNSLLIFSIAALAACGGGGGSGGGSANEIDKVTITTPANGSELTSLDGNIQLRRVAAFENLFVILNGEDITPYFDSGLSVSLTAVQGILVEGQNTLRVGAKGSNTKTSVFTADVVKPLPVITNVNDATASSPIFDLEIRKAKMQSLQYSNDNGVNFSDVGNTSVSTTPVQKVVGASVNVLSAKTNDAEADLIFQITDDSATLVGGAGNASEVALALPGRKFNAAGATQINNSALAVPKGWIPEIARLLLSKMNRNPADTPDYAVEKPILDFDDTAAIISPNASGVDENICQKVKQLFSNVVVVAADAARCQIFINEFEIADSGASGLADDLAVDFAVTGPVLNGAQLKVLMEQKTAGKITFVGEVVIYKDSDYIQNPKVLTPLAKVSLPMKLAGTKLEFDFSLVNVSGNMNLELAAFGVEGGSTKSNAVSIVKGTVAYDNDGACVDIVSGACLSTTSAITSTTINIIANNLNANISTADVQRAEVAIDEQIAIRLFCDVDADQVTPGHDDEACDGTEIAVAKAGRVGVLFESKVDVDTDGDGTLDKKADRTEIKHEDVVQATRITASEVSSLKPVDGNTGLFLQMSSGIQTVLEDQSGTAVTNSDFNPILGTLFKSLDASSGLALQNFDGETTGDIFASVTANSLNQLLVSFFQAGLIDKQQPKLNMCNVLGGCDALVGGLFFDPVSKGLPLNGFTMPRVGRYDEAEITLELGSMPMVSLVSDADGGYMELVINGLDVKADIAQSPGFYNPANGKSCINTFEEGCVGAQAVTKGDAIPNALSMLVDVIARVRLTKDDATHLPKFEVETSDVSLSVAQMETFLDRKYLDAKSRAQNDIRFIPVRDALYQQLITAGDITVLVAKGLEPLLEQFSAQLVQENIYTFKATDLGLAETKQLEAVLTNFAVNPTGNYLLFATDICDNSDSETSNTGGCKNTYGNDVKGLVTLKITN